MNKSVLGLFGVIAALIVGLGLVALVLVGGGDDGGGSGGGDLLNPGATQTPGGSAQSACSGGTDLRLLGGEPITLDPALAGDAGSATYIVEIFGGLLTIDRDLKIINDIAESYDVSADGKVYTFKIRRNALFHDGRPVTAADFKYSMERTANQATASTTADAYLGDIVGAKDMIRGRANSISGIKVVDSSTLQIEIDQPKPYFLAKLTYPTAFVVDRTQVEANPRNWTRRPNGTGPYKLAEWRLNERIILEANPRYHLGAPAVQRVLFNLAGGSSLTQYENGEIDVSGIGINDIERVRSTRDPLNKEYKTRPELSIGYIGFNTKTAPFDDAKVREAFAISINRELLLKVVGKDMNQVANSFLPAGSPGYNASASLPAFDPARARQLLQESKYQGRLPPITFTEAGGGANVGLGTQALIEDWKTNLGIEVSLTQTEIAAFYDDLDRGTLQMFSSGWIMDYPDPENVLDVLFLSTSRQNNTRYSNPEFDALVLQARTESDVERRFALYRQAEAILIKDLPWIPINFGSDHFVVKPCIQGFDPTPMVIPRLRYVTITK